MPATATPPAQPAAAPAAPAPAAKPAAPPAPTPMETAFSDMEKYAMDDEPAAPTPPATPPKPAEGKPADTKPATPPKPAAELKPGEGETRTEEGKPEPGDPSGMTKPWDLVKFYRNRSRTLEKEMAGIKGKQPSAQVPQETQERMTALETRNKQLEDEIQFTNYSKSQDYIDNYEAPYKEAWARALSDVKELSITNEDGTSRAATHHDLVTLANLPLGKARIQAKEWFGEAADDMMAHRRTLLELSDKQAKALDDARKNGAARAEQKQREQQAKDKTRSEETSRLWNEVNSELTGKYEFLRPVEGQTERNEKLEAAVKFVDESMGLNVSQAKTEEERKQIIRRHAALRSRAIAYTPLKLENKQLKARVAELEKSLGEYQTSEPTNGEPGRGGGAATTGDLMEQSLAGLAKLAT